MLEDNAIAKMTDEELQKTMQGLLYELYYDYDLYDARDNGDEEYEYLSGSFKIPPDPDAFDSLVYGNNNFIMNLEDELEDGALNDYNKVYLDKAVQLEKCLYEWDKRFLLSKEEQIRAKNKSREL